MLIKHTEKEVDLLARIMRAEALGEGNLGMLMVGNVVVNRVIANCDLFRNTKTITQVIYQKNGFEGLNSNLFNSRPTKKETDLAKKCLKGEYYYPATNALWFYAPGKNKTCKKTWFNQEFAGRYKGHCFYMPNVGKCPQIR